MNTTTQAAPTFSLFGSFFPAWLVCAIAGIVGALVLRAVLSVIRLDDGIPFKLLTYTCAAVAIDCSLWLLMFGP
ncbi:YtcA family lipoprotein [Methylorubrum rhodesianum]|uniref:YtcA family lipoprotein n=1 Tax=Methylorubrum rhodesianum TaxID=29427 RepID=UPI003D02AD18